jgi:hypothetical protein
MALRIGMAPFNVEKRRTGVKRRAFRGTIAPMSRTSALPRIAALVAALLAGGGAAADPTNYQRYVIGERALGMGGAQTAAVNDPMANLYNPAAMVFTTSTMVSASKCLYSLDSRRVQDGFVPSSSWSGTADAVTLEQRNDLTLPSTLALSTKFGPRLEKSGSQRHAIGVAILVPNQDKFTLRGRWRAAGDVQDTETYALSESYTQVWMGLSYAFRAIDEFGLGVSMFLSTTAFDRGMTQSRYGSVDGCTLLNCGYMEFRESALSIDTVSLLFRVGALWQPSANWRFGLTISAPSILIPDLKIFSTKGSLSQTFGVAKVVGTEDDRVEYFSDSYELKIGMQEPMSFRAGAAYLWGDMFTVDFDVAAYLPVSYRRIGGDPVMERRCPEGLDACNDPDNPVVDERASPEWYDLGIVRSIERRAVVNFNLGWELIVDDTWTIRNGVFTDFSAAPPVVAGERPQQTRVNRYGAGLALGFKAKGYDISVGVTGSLGQGQASVFDPHRADSPWQPTAVTERALYVFLAGIQAAAVKGSKTIVKKTQEKIEERRADGEDVDGDDEDEDEADAPEGDPESADAPAGAGGAETQGG